MINKKNRPSIAIFVDYPNIEISLQEYINIRYPNISMIKNYASRLGKIEFLKVYGDWNMLDLQIREIKKVPRIKLINEPHLKNGNGTKKDAVDMRIALDIGICLEKFPKIDIYILVSGDADFLPVLRQVKMRGKQIIIIAEENSLSWHLKWKFRNIMTYQQLLSDYTEIATKKFLESSIPKLKAKLDEGVV